MIDLSEPKIYFLGTGRKFKYSNMDYWLDWFGPQYLTKVCIDYSKKRIRGSLKYKEEFRKEHGNQQCYWFNFDDELLRLD